jgi:hypothetical protein
MGRVKGICYGNDAFPAPYNPSIANSTQVFFGSDNTADYIGSLFRSNYANSVQPWCQSMGPGETTCRADLPKMQTMGVEIIRLYDWDPRNPHDLFLDACHNENIGVLVSVSNYFLQPGGGLPDMNKQIPALIQSFSQGGDYHPAIQGIVFGNEFDLPGNGISVANCVSFTNTWASIEQQQFSSHRKLPIGHPVSFAMQNGRPPCWYAWDQLIPQLSGLNSRLFLAPQTYNSADYLFQNDGSGAGWVDRTYNQYNLPIWFTEIGQDRTKPDHVNIVMGQLSGCIKYNKQNPSKLIGCCMFSYADKAWMQGTSEGSFGAWTHAAAGPITVTYTGEDFTHWDAPTLGTLNVDQIAKTDLYAAIVNCYKTS